MGSKTNGCNITPLLKWVQYVVYMKLFPMIEFLCCYISKFIIIIIIIIIIILIITFIHVIYSYIPEAICFSMVCSVAAVLYLQFLLYVILFRPWNMFLH
jgi:hypothetical protein